ECGDFRTDLGTPAAAGENPVVAAARRRQDLAFRGRQVGAERVGRVRLARTGNVVELALDRHEGRAADGRGLDMGVFDGPGAARQAEFLEDRADGVQVE